MKLANLNNARFVKVYEDSQRVYAWFGGLGVSIYDFELNEIDYFTMDFSNFSNHCNSRVRLFTLVKQTIELHEDELFMDEDCTNDMFVSHELETGEDLEMQA